MRPDLPDLQAFSQPVPGPFPILPCFPCFLVSVLCLGISVVPVSSGLT